MPELPFNILASPSILELDEVELVNIVRRARMRDHAAFASLYHYYKPFIWKCLVSLVGKKEIAYDLFQETFLRAWQKLPTMNQEVPFKSWLKRVAVNIAIDYLRRENKRIFLQLSEDEWQYQSSLDLHHSAGSDEYIDLKERIQQTLQHMSPQNRCCVLLQDQWGFSQREIAQLLHISEKTVSATVSRGREQFRQVYSHLMEDQQQTQKGET